MLGGDSSPVEQVQNDKKAIPLRTTNSFEKNEHSTLCHYENFYSCSKLTRFKTQFGHETK